jgi:hypothetical protein
MFLSDIKVDVFKKFHSLFEREANILAINVAEKN